MYRKRMSEALREARAYTAINEVMVFKGGRGMNVSKQDLPVFKAKGWKLKEELEEANMKKIASTLQDKLSKEVAAFDDLKKTAKTMGVDLTPDMLKGAPGIKQHRDGDYILEGTMIGGIVTDSGMKIYVRKLKKIIQTLKDFMSKKKSVTITDNKVMAFIFDDELLDDLYVKKNRMYQMLDQL